jgi:AAA domain
LNDGTAGVWPLQPPSTVASVKFLLTHADKQALRGLGYSDEAISHMTPETGAGIIAQAKAEVIPPKPPRPARVTPNDNVVNELAPLPNWVLWRYWWDPDTKQGEGGWTKPPYLPKTYHREPPHPTHASSMDPNTWRTRATAMGAYNASLGWSDPFDGIGFVLDGKPDANGDCIGCLDLDAWGEGEQQLLKLLGPTYAERSPSGRGVHALFRCRPFSVATCKTDTLKAEMYCEKRYVTVTGQRIEGAPETIEALPPDAIAAVLAEMARAKGLVPRKARHRKFEPLRNPDGSLVTQSKLFDGVECDGGELSYMPVAPPDPLDFDKLWSAVWALPDVIIADENDWMNLVCRALANEAMRLDDDPATTEWLYNLLDARSRIDAQGATPKEYNEAKNRQRFERCMDEYNPDDPVRRPILSGSIYQRAEEHGWSAPVAPGSGSVAASAAIARVKTLTAEQLGLVTIGSRSTLPPPRPWAQGAWMLYGEVMLLGGPTAFGKTAVGVTMGLAFGSGRALLGQKIFSGPQRVLHISSEEPTDELERRYLAAESPFENRYS